MCLPRLAPHLPNGCMILALLANVVREDWVQITFLTFGNTFTGEAADPEQLGAVERALDELTRWDGE